MRKNKIETSQYKDYVIGLLENGTTVREIEKLLKEKGFDVSHTAINEFRAKMEIVPNEMEIEQFVDNEDFKLELDTKTPLADLQKLVFDKQLRIVAAKQDLFIQGKIKKFPDVEFRALKTMNDLLAKNEINPKDDIQ